MDPFLDDFIAYETQCINKIEGLQDPEFSLSSPFSENSDSTSVFPSFLPKTIKNLLDPVEAVPTVSSQCNNQRCAKKPKPFQIIKCKKEESTELSEVTDPPESVESFNTREESQSKLHSKSKRIMKQSKGKDKIRASHDPETIIKKVDSKYIPEGFDNPDLDDNTKKKMIQMIRNRISAQSSRDKKKMYLLQLEELRDDLIEENTQLNKEKAFLLEKISKLEKEHALLLQENENFKRNTSYICSKCASTLEYEDSSEKMETDPTSLSNVSSPVLNRKRSQNGRFFGFSLGFAAILCLLFVMNGAQYGGFPGMGNNKATNLITFTKNYISQKDSEICSVPDNLFKGAFEAKVKEFKQAGITILNNIKELMDEFERLHEAFFESFENDKIASLEQTVPVKETHDSELSGLASSETPLYCPNGFDFFNGELAVCESLFIPPPNDNTTHEQENSINYLDAIEGRKALNSKSRVLDLEKAEYLQILVPKRSISKLEIAGTTTTPHGTQSSHILSSHKNEEEGNALVEVWCKVFAVKDTVSSL